MIALDYFQSSLRHLPVPVPPPTSTSSHTPVTISNHAHAAVTVAESKAASKSPQSAQSAQSVNPDRDFGSDTHGGLGRNVRGGGDDGGAGNGVGSNEIVSVELFSSAEEEKTLRRQFAFVQDGDLWTWRIPESKSFRKGVSDIVEKKPPELFECLMAARTKTKDLIALGASRLAEDQKLIDHSVSLAFPVNVAFERHGGLIDTESLPTSSEQEVDNRTFLAVCCDVPHLRSEIGNALAELSKKRGLRAMAGVIYTEKELGSELYKLSLRSTGDEDATVVARLFGGGGHKNACSCVIGRDVLQNWIMKSPQQLSSLVVPG